MLRPAQDRRAKEVVRLLARADRFNQLAKLAPRSYKGRFYRLKDVAAEKAICMSPEQFEVDSIEYGPDLVLGITHSFSKRRLHIRPYRLSGRAQIALHQLAAETGHRYPLLRWADQGGLDSVALARDGVKEASGS